MIICIAGHCKKKTKIVDKKKHINPRVVVAHTNSEALGRNVQTTADNSLPLQIIFITRTILDFLSNNNFDFFLLILRVCGLIVSRSLFLSCSLTGSSDFFFFFCSRTPQTPHAKMKLRLFEFFFLSQRVCVSAVVSLDNIQCNHSKKVEQRQQSNEKKIE